MALDRRFIGSSRFKEIETKGRRTKSAGDVNTVAGFCAGTADRLAGRHAAYH